MCNCFVSLKSRFEIHFSFQTSIDSVNSTSHIHMHVKNYLKMDKQAKHNINSNIY